MKTPLDPDRPLVLNPERQGFCVRCEQPFVYHNRQPAFFCPPCKRVHDIELRRERRRRGR